MNTFAEVLELVDSMSADDQESLVQIVQARLRDERRAQITRDILGSRKEVAEGKCVPETVDEIMARIVE
jgi:hypothetical protein